MIVFITIGNIKTLLSRMKTLQTENEQGNTGLEVYSGSNTYKRLSI